MAQRNAFARFTPAWRGGHVRTAALEATFSPAQLRKAWLKVRANGGGPGGDGVSLTRFGWRAHKRLAMLRAGLLDGSYRPGRLRHVALRRPGRGPRQLAIPTITDRIAQTAMLLALARRLLVARPEGRRKGCRPPPTAPFVYAPSTGPRWPSPGRPT